MAPNDWMPVSSALLCWGSLPCNCNPQQHRENYLEQQHHTIHVQWTSVAVVSNCWMMEKSTLQCWLNPSIVVHQPWKLFVPQPHRVSHPVLPLQNLYMWSAWVLLFSSCQTESHKPPFASCLVQPHPVRTVLGRDYLYVHSPCKQTHTKRALPASRSGKFRGHWWRHWGRAFSKSCNNPVSKPLLPPYTCHANELFHASTIPNPKFALCQHRASSTFSCHVWVNLTYDCDAQCQCARYACVIP